MLYPDKFYLTQDLNRRFARTNLARLIFSDLHFEKTNISLIQTQLVADGLMHSDTSITDKAMTLMYHNMRNQLFWGGNKRTATLAANKLMIDHGAGLINVPLDKWDHWNKLISEYYLTGKMNTLKEWTYENGIQGVVLNNNSNLPKPDINPADYD